MSAVTLSPSSSEPAPPPPPSNSFRPVSRWSKLLGFRLLWPCVALALLLAYNALFTPGFFDVRLVGDHLYGSLIDVLAVGAPVAIVAVGMTLVIATGGVDLSVGSVMAISGSIAAMLLVDGHRPFAAAAAVALVASLAIGIVNGLLVAVARIQPIVATLIVMVAGRGVAQLVTNGQKINFADPTYVFLGNGYFAYLPFGVTLVAIALLVVGLATRRTALGLAIESIGDSPSASRYVGLRVNTITVASYAICALCAGVAGFVAASRIRTADPLNVGVALELDAIFAVVVGGTALTGGRFTLVGSIVGSLLLQALGTTLLSTKIGGHDIRPDMLPLPKAIVIVVVCLLQSAKFRDAVVRPFKRRGGAR